MYGPFNINRRINEISEVMSRYQERCRYRVRIPKCQALHIPIPSTTKKDDTRVPSNIETSLIIPNSDLSIHIIGYHCIFVL